MKRGLVNHGKDNDNHDDDPPRNKRFRFTKCWCKDEQRLLENSAQLENFFRKVVGEEVDRAVLPYLPSSSRWPPNQAEQTKPRKYKLQFVGILPRRFFTENKVEAEGPSSIKVLLLDALSGQIIKDGHLSSLKVEIVVLQGHFKAEQVERWTKKEFCDNIVTTRDGKRPLLIGECVISLCNGMGLIIKKIFFTDNSSWVRSKMFRLGARVFMAKEEDVMEAVSSPFEVKDKRGENYQKHKTPSPEDEVWRLHGIAKNGKICKRLADHQIHKVKDLFHFDQDLLRQILGVSFKQLKGIFEQASSSFSSIIYTNPSDFSPNDIPTEPISETADIPSLNLQQFCVPPPNSDQPEIPMSYNDGTNHNHLLHDSMPFNQIIDNNFLMGNLLNGSCDDGHGYALNYPMNPTSPTGPLFGQQDMFDVPASNWFTITRSMGGEGNGSVVGSSSNFQIEPIDPLATDVAGSSGSNNAKSKAGWSKIRAVWRILVKNDDATLRKGKFASA